MDEVPGEVALDEAETEKVSEPRQHPLRRRRVDCIHGIRERLPLQQFGMRPSRLDEFGLVGVEEGGRLSGESLEAGRSRPAMSAIICCTRPDSSSCCWSARRPSSTERAVEPKSVTVCPSWRRPAPWKTLPAVCPTTMRARAAASFPLNCVA